MRFFDFTQKASWLFLAFLLLPHGFTIPAAAERPPDDIPLCTLDYDPLVDAIINAFDQSEFERHLKETSGYESAFVDGEQIEVKTRYSQPVFRGRPYARAVEYIVQECVQAGLDPELLYYPGLKDDTYINIVAEIPGEVNPDTVYVLCAHFDSRSEESMTVAPGADDNGTGVAFLLSAARILQAYRFENTIRIIFFSAEETARWGSTHYTEWLFNQGESVAGALNFDMFGWDGDNDRLMQVHVGTIPESAVLGQVFYDVNDLYLLGLNVEIYAEDVIGTFSDHVSFWEYGWPAFSALEHMLPPGGPDTDVNPGYHTTSDTYDGVTLSYAADIARSGLGTAASVAVPIQACSPPATAGLTALSAGDNHISLSWTPHATAGFYEIYRNTLGCGKGFELIGSSSEPLYDDLDVYGGITYYYKVRTFDGCLSPLSDCVSVDAVGPCRRAPEFAGAARVENQVDAICSLLVEWNPASSRCPADPNVTYNVYRSRNPGFLPSDNTLLALGVNTLSFYDTSDILPGASYFYIVQAEDETSGGDGPANGGNLDGNLYRLNGMATGMGTSIFFDDMESGEGGWQHGAIYGEEEWEVGTPTGVGRHDPDGAYSGTGVWATDLGTGFDEGDYWTNTHSYLQSPVVDCTGFSGVHLRYRRWLATQDRVYDQARIRIMDGGVTVFENPYSPTRADFVDLAWTLDDLDIGRFVDNRTFSIRFELQSNPSGHLGGWNIDDVRVYSADTCAPFSTCTAPPRDIGNTLMVVKESLSAVLSWTEPVEAPAFRVYRGTARDLSDLSVVSPDPYDQISYTDPVISDDQSYYYKVQALNACGDGPY
ncbi:M20/M25/M40 family metallo-hydrolase [Acidobacteriota bacterium]